MDSLAEVFVAEVTGKHVRENDLAQRVRSYARTGTVRDSAHTIETTPIHVLRRAAAVCAQLNDFLPSERRMQTITCSFDVSGSVKDMIEAMGVPHTEVDFILVNGEPVDFGYRVRDGDRVSVFPRFQSIDIGPLVNLRPAALGERRFVADGHLGRLAAYLRMLGFDTLYRSSYRDEEVARLSSSENRILLTRDRGLLKRMR